MTDLRINLFGGFRVVVDGRTVVPEAWSRRKPAALVKLLALAPGHRLRREQMMEMLWPEFEPPAAAANLRKAAHSARRILDAGEGGGLIVSAGDLLCLPSNGISIDVSEYWSLAGAARRTRDVDAYAAAIELYRSGLLPEDLYEEWASAPRDELHADWLALVEEYASLLEAGGDLNGAARAVQRLVAVDPLREDSHAWLMRLYALAGRRDEAQRQYARLCELLADELGVEPSAETQRLFEEIRAEQASEPSLTTDLWERVGELRMRSGDPAAAVKAFSQALSIPSRSETVGRIHRKCASAWLMLHRPDDAEPHLSAADRLTPDPAEQGRLRCLRAKLAWERGNLGAARQLAEQAHDAALAHGDADDVAAALEALAFISHMQGDWRPGLQNQIERLAGVALGVRVARFCDFNHCLSQYQLYGDDFTGDVAEYARQTLAIAERVDAVPAQAFAWCLLGESLLLHAQWDEAAACLERSCELYEPLGSRSVALPWLRRAELAACVGDHGEVAVFLKRATAIATVTPMARHAWARLHATAALAAMERGEPEAAIRSVRAAQSAAARYGDCPTCSALINPVGAQAFALVGAPEGAHALAESAAQLAGSFTSSVWSAMADSAAGHAALAGGDLTDARRRLQSAADGYEKAGHTFWVHRTLAQLNAAGTEGGFHARERSRNAAELASSSTADHKPMSGGHLYVGRFTLSLTIGDIAPNFVAATTHGAIEFHEWIGGSWAVLFSHPKDFTPICTTELGYMAAIKPEFDRRGVKIMALSVDPVDEHAVWAADIEETQGTAPNYPMIGDADFVVSRAYGMLGADVSGDPADRTAADNQTVRGVYVIGPDKKIKLILLYPMTTGRNFDEILRVIDSLQLTARHKVATPANWQQGQDVVIAGSVSNEQAKEVFGSWKEPKPYIRIVPQPA